MGWEKKSKREKKLLIIKETNIFRCNFTHVHYEYNLTKMQCCWEKSVQEFFCFFNHTIIFFLATVGKY